MKAVLKISGDSKNLSSTIFVRQNQILKTKLSTKIMHTIIIRLQQFSKVVQFGSNHYYVMNEFGS